MRLARNAAQFRMYAAAPEVPPPRGPGGLLQLAQRQPAYGDRRVLGAEASSRGYVEVFISPVPDQVAGIQGVLVTMRHELVHPAGRRGHGKAFKALAVELGLIGPMTATVASPELQDFINWTLLP